MGRLVPTSEYGKDDALIAYALCVLRDGLVVRRSEIPRDKNVHRQHARDQRTPEDALYLAYCPSPPCGFRNVYWLAFIEEHEAVDPRLHQRDYFALTCRGLTHFEAGAATEFVDVASWVHEKRAFDHMTSMRGLERIQQMLFFFSWKRKAVKNKHKRVQARLRESLFTCHAVAARVLRRIRAECLEIEGCVGPYKRVGRVSYTLPEFQKLHQERLDAARRFIHAKIEAICEIVSREACLPGQPVMRSVSYTPANLASLTNQLEAARLRERMFPFLRLAEFKLAEAVRTHSISFLRSVCRNLCGEHNSASHLEARDGPVSLQDTAILYAQVVGAVNTDDHVSGTAPLEIRPSKDDVLELLHSVFARYLSTMDAIPRLMMDSRFQHVLTPFEPTFRAVFCRSLAKPSSLAFEACAADLAHLRDAADDCYQRVERLRVDHLRCTLAIKVAESSTVETNAGVMLSPTSSSRSDSPEANTSSATAYETALKTWNRFMQYADAAGGVLHIGFLHVDQQTFVTDMKNHVARHLAHMNELLPKEYQALLQSLVDDVDARIDRVTKVPGNLESAMAWIDQVTEMLPTHPLRQLFDAKCRNLARLKVLAKERASVDATAAMEAALSASSSTNDQSALASSLLQQQQQLEGSLRKLEVAWESLYETLLMCLDRVQDRNSVHRRSLDELASKTEEHIGDQLHQILAVFADLPTGIERELKPPQPAIQTDIVNRLEELVELDTERFRVVRRYAAYEREYRMVSELPSAQWITTLGCADTRSSSGTRGPDEKLPSEMLLQYIVTALELRHWYTSWSALRSKWETSPIVQVHPGVILDRIKQFRKRVVVSARRMNRLSAALLKTPVMLERAARKDVSSPWGFAAPDLALTRAFLTSIDDMARCSKVFLAVNGESFGDQHWGQLQGLLTHHTGAVKGLRRDRFALQQVLEAMPSDSDHAEQSKRMLMAFFDDCIVESRLHSQLERSRQRLARVRVQICEENYTVRCDGVDEALRELDDIIMDVKLCLFQQNPELQECMETCAEVERQMVVCEYVLQFQRKWLPMFDWLKLHDVEDFVASQLKLHASSKTNSGPSDTTAGCNDENVWKAFTMASQRWSDCMRRIYFARPQNLKRTATSESNASPTLKSKSKASRIRASTSRALVSESPVVDTTEATGASKKRSCSLHELARGFQNFDFEQEIAACEQGMSLARGYLSMLRAKSPRLFLVEDADLLHLLTHDQDLARFHLVLTRCFPHVTRFSIKRCSPHYELDLDGSAPSSDSGRFTDDTLTSILVDGTLDTRGASSATWPFRMPVTKIGRVKFWLSRIEEEVAMMVRGNVRVALQWVMTSTELYPDVEVDTSEAADALPSLSSPQLLLLPQSIAAAAIFRFSYEVTRLWIRETPAKSSINAVRRLEDLRKRQEKRMSELITDQRGVMGSGITTERSPRQLANIENLLLLLRFQEESLRHILQLLRVHRDEDARFFWAMQYKVHLYQLSTSAAAPLSAGAGSSNRQGARAERVDLSCDIDAAIDGIQRRDMESVEMYAQVAHVELAIGHEFTGWSRIPILSPLSQRCAFALMSAVRAQKTPTVIAPYSAGSNDVASTLSVVATLAQLLMIPMLQVNCSSDTSLTKGDVTRLEAHLDATLALNAMVLIHDVGRLGRPSQRMIQERLLRRSLTDRAVATQGNGTNSSMAASTGARFTGGPPLATPVVIIPFTSRCALQQSGLLDTIQRRVRAVAIPPVAIGLLVESLLLAHGYSRDQSLRTGAIGAFEALATSACGFEDKCCGVSVRAIVPKIIGEAMRLRASYRVILSSVRDDLNVQHSPSSKIKPGLSPSDDSTDEEALERRIDQTVFRISLLDNIEVLVTAKGCNDATTKALTQFSALVDAFFPHACRTRAALQLKRSEADEAVTNAVEICLEESGFATRSNHHRYKLQFERIMELWKIIQVHDGIIVHGAVGSGKSTSIKVLHRALAGLALASNMDCADTSRSSSGMGCSDLSALTVLNSGALSLDQLEAEIARVMDVPDGLQPQQQSQQGDEPGRVDMNPPRWIIVDGVLDSAMMERVMALSASGWRNNNDSDERNLAASVTRYLARSAQANGSQSCCSRVIFETTDLRGLSPVSLTHYASIHISASCISYEAVVFAWKRQWEKRLRVTALTDASEQIGIEAATPGLGKESERLGLLFKTVDTLLSVICMPFVEAENAHNDQSKDATSKTPRLMGGLSLAHMTSSALSLLALWSFSCSQSWRNDETLTLPPAALIEMTAFAMLWGFTGHLPHAMQHKLEFYLRAKAKDSLELRHLSDAPGSLLDASRFDEWSADDGGGCSVLSDEWIMPTPSSSAFGNTATHDDASSELPLRLAAGQSVFDSSSGHLIALLPVALPLVRICSRLVHADKSFVLIGPAASGKTSLLRWLQHANDDAQTAETMVDCALDQQQTHSILDWLAMPASWFNYSATTWAGSGELGTELRTRAREENELCPMLGACSFVFVDDLCVDNSGITGADVDYSARTEFLRTVLDHGVCFSSERSAFLAVHKRIGAAMRLNGDTTSAKRDFPSAVSRLLRHFVVLHTPDYGQKDLLSVFRTKFRAHFDSVPTAMGFRPGSKQNETSSSALTAEEVVLRASTDWMAELSVLRDSLRVQGVDNTDARSITQALTFNWHHLSVVLDRTLAFARELPSCAQDQRQERPTLATGRMSDRHPVTLVELGRLHQSWISELQNVFLVNWPLHGTTQQFSGSDQQSVVTAGPSNSEKLETVSKKLWAIVRLVSEKYFSAALQDEMAMPVSIASAYFSLRLAVNHAHAPLLQATHAVELRELLTALASSAPSVGALARSTRRSIATPLASALDPDQRLPIAERIVNMLIEIETSAQASASRFATKRPNAASYHKRGAPLSPKYLELRLLLSSPTLLTQCMHVVHAMGPLTPHSPLLVVSSRTSVALAHRMAAFACSLHGFQVQLLGRAVFRVNKRDQHGDKLSSSSARHNVDMRSLLVDVLFAVGVQQKRIALWVDWTDVVSTDIDHATSNDAAPDNDAVLQFLAMVEELCLDQIPTLVLDQGHATNGVVLRDAILMGCIQAKDKMETTSEAEILRDFCSGVRRNLRVCVFDSDLAVFGDMISADTATQGGGKAARARLHTLRNWMQTRTSCRMLRLVIRDHEVAPITLVMAEKAVVMLASTARDGDTTKTSSQVPLPRDVTAIPPEFLVALHFHLMALASTADEHNQIANISPEQSVEYFLSFTLNLHVHWQRVVERETKTYARYQHALEQFDVIATRLLPWVEARCAHLDATIQSLSELIGDDSEAGYPIAQSESESSCGVPDNTHSVAELLIQREYDAWCRRSRREEHNMMRCELEVERQTLVKFMVQWQQALPRAEALVTRWQECVKARQSDQFWSNRLGDTIFRIVGMSYSFMWSLPCVYDVEDGVNQILKEHGLYQHETLSLELDEDAQMPLESINDSDRRNKNENLLSSVESDSVTQFLAKLLMTAELPVLHHGRVLEILRAGCDLVGRAPVFMDPLGVVQRLFVRCFSGQPLLTSAPSDKGRSKGSRLRTGTDGSAASNVRTQHQKVSGSAPAIIVSSTDPDLHIHLADAQRRNLPVLLLDFSPSDQLCATLSPFLSAIKCKSIAPDAQQPLMTQSCSLLEQLAVETYRTHALNRSSRCNNRRTASVTIGSAMAAIGASAVRHPSVVLPTSNMGSSSQASISTAMDRRRRRSIDRRPDMAALASMLGRKSLEPRHSEIDSHHRSEQFEFQIVAIASSAVDLSSQHQRSDEYAFYSLSMNTRVLGHDFFSRLWMARADNDCSQAQHCLHEAERFVADGSVLVADWRDKFWAAISDNGSVKRSRFSKREAFMPLASVTRLLQRYECIRDALVALDQHERRLALSSEQLEKTKNIFDASLGGYSAAGMRVARLGRSISIFPALLPAPLSILYKRSHRWLEYRVTEELATAITGPSESSGKCYERSTNDSIARADADAAVIVQGILTSIGCDLISQAHRQLLAFVVAVESAAMLATSTSSINGDKSAIEHQHHESKPFDALFLQRALSWLSSNDATVASAFSNRRPVDLPRQSVEVTTSESFTSLVDRFRRKVRLGALLVDFFSSSSRKPPSLDDSQPRDPGREQTASNGMEASSPALTLSQDGRQSYRPLLKNLVVSPSFTSIAAVDTSQKDMTRELQEALTALFTVVEDLWADWKAAKLEQRRGVERLLGAHGIRRARRTSLRQLEIAAAAAAASIALSSDSDASGSDGSTIRVKSLADVLAEFNLYGSQIIENHQDGVVGHDMITEALAKLLLSYAFFPDEVAEVAADWCEVVMALSHPQNRLRQSISEEDQVTTTTLNDQSTTDTASPIESGSTSQRLETGAPSRTLTTLIADVSPTPNQKLAPGNAGKSPLVLLPTCLLVYSPATDQLAQQRAEKWLKSMAMNAQSPRILTWWWSSTQTSREDGSAREYYDQLVTLVTSAPLPPTSESKQPRRFFAVELLAPSHFDAAVAMISRVVNEHALLAAPEWVAVCSLSVAVQITSNKLPLLPRVFVDAATDSGDTDRSIDDRHEASSLSSVTPQSTFDEQESDSISEHLGWLQSGLAASIENEREIAQAALLRCFLPRNRLQSGCPEDEDHPHQHHCEEDPVGGFEAASRRPTAVSSLVTSPAALSSDLAADIAVARHGILSLVHGKSSVAAISTSSEPHAAGDLVIQRIADLFDHLRHTADALSAAVLISASSSPSTEPLLLPWWSLQREVETQTAFFHALDTHLQTLLSPTATRLDPTHLTTAACVSRGFIPLAWIASALESALGRSGSLPRWPRTMVATAQLALLLAYRFALLANWLSSRNCRRLTRALDLASVYDARGLLHALKVHFASRSGVPLRDVRLALSYGEDASEEPNLEDYSEWELGAAIKRRLGNSSVVVGLRVEGIVLLELGDGDTTTTGAVVALHALPPCWIMCRVRSDGTTDRSSPRDGPDSKLRLPRCRNRDRRVPLVMLASLSPFYSQSTAHEWASPGPSDERLDWIELEVEPGAVGVALVQQQQQSFVDDDLPDEPPRLALGVPLFATDDNTPSGS